MRYLHYLWLRNVFHLGCFPIVAVLVTADYKIGCNGCYFPRPRIRFPSKGTKVKIVTSCEGIRRPRFTITCSLLEQLSLLKIFTTSSISNIWSGKSMDKPSGRPRLTAIAIILLISSFFSTPSSSISNGSSSNTTFATSALVPFEGAATPATAGHRLRWASDGVAKTFGLLIIETLVAIIHNTMSTFDSKLFKSWINKLSSLQYAVHHLHAEKSFEWWNPINFQLLLFLDCRPPAPFSFRVSSKRRFGEYVLDKILSGNYGTFDDGCWIIGSFQ